MTTHEIALGETIQTGLTFKISDRRTTLLSLALLRTKRIREVAEMENAYALAYN